MFTNIIPEIVALPFALTLYFFMLFRYRNQSRKDVSFRHNLLVVSISIIIDILDCIVMDTGMVSESLIIGIHTLSLISYAFIPFFYILYIYDYSDDISSSSRTVLTVVSYIVFTADAVLFVQNLINENIFGTDENGRFFRSDLYAVFAFGTPFIFGIYALISTIVFRKKIRRSQFIVIIFSFIIVGISIFLQLTVFSDYYVILAGVTIGLYEMFLSHETPEYYELAETLKDLEKSREEEKQAKLKAIAADEAKTQFLTQMSHEIRTPINAIMGYNNIIMEDTLEDTTREYSRKARLASRRLIDFFDSLFEYIDIGGEAAIKEITQSNDSKELQDDDFSAEITGTFSGAQELRILVVDDTEMNVELLVRMLRSMGFETESASDGEKALECIYSTHYDLIFMDHMMPVMDGMEAMKKIREEKLCENTPVIMLTANTIKGEKEKYLEAGFAEYVTKPFSVASIKEVVLKFLPVDEELISQSSWSGEWRQLQKELPFLRLSSAKEYFMSDADFFIKAVTLFAKSTVASKLEEYISSADYYNYRAVLCSIKDSSKMIGADMLSERTSVIEKLYIRGDIDELKKKHTAFIDSIQKLIKQLSAALYISDSEIDTNAISYQTDTRPMILILSGDDEISNKIFSILEQHYRVTVKSRADEGIIRAQEDNPVLIILDDNVESMSSYDVMLALRSVEETAEIPVLFMTSDMSGEAEINSFRNGVFDLVRKPYVPEVFENKIHRIVELTALRKHLRREILRQTEKVGHLSHEVMIALSKAVDAKDRYTNDHSQRVARYASMIAKQLGKSRSCQDDLYIIGLLHDVGKIGVHEEIINKPGKLSPKEYDEIKSHTTVGYEILKVITEMPEAANCARWHHERYDGHGYPDGLSGSDIPEFARIICVADSYDAMTSRRSYQPLKAQSVVREEILRCKGTQFDPVIADAMVRIIDEDQNYKLHG